MAEMEPTTDPTPVPEPETPGPAAVPEATGAAEASEAGAPPVVGLTPEEEEEKRRKRRLGCLLLFLLALLGLLTLFSAWYLLYRKPVTELLPPVGLDEAPHYLFSIYGVDKPMGVAVTATGDRVYVTESSGDRVTKVFDRAGQPIGDLRPPTDSLPHTPVYLAVDQASGDVYVTDRVTGSIYIYDASGTYRTTFKPTVPIPAWQPLGIALASGGDLWVTDLSAPYQRIEVFGRDGALKQTIGEPGQFDFPNMIAFDAAGNAYVTDSNNGRVIVIDPQGSQVVGISRGANPGALGLPRGIAVDDKGRVYVVDATGQTVHIYRTDLSSDLRPTFTKDFGTEGAANGEFVYPNGVAADTRARVYVTDRENDRVQVWGY
jgi:DNA-binding beta-propeller fold protein YncE